MTSSPHFKLSSFTPGSSRDVRAGLLGWIVVEFGGLARLDGITLRRTAAGRLTLSFPERRDRSGKRHAVVRPLDSDARQEIERQVLDQLREQGALS